MEIISIFMDMCVRSETKRSFSSLLLGRLFVEIAIFVCYLFGAICSNDIFFRFLQISLGNAMNGVMLSFINILFSSK